MEDIEEIRKMAFELSKSSFLQKEIVSSIIELIECGFTMTSDEDYQWTDLTVKLCKELGLNVDTHVGWQGINDCNYEIGFVRLLPPDNSEKSLFQWMNEKAKRIKELESCLQEVREITEDLTNELKSEK